MLLLSCLALSLPVAGCGGDDGDDGGSAGTTQKTERQPAEETTGAAKPGGAVTVSMKNTLFVPRDVKVKVGDTIRWTNDDPFPHTVTKTGGPGPKFDSGTVDGGEAYKQKFTQAGKIDYVCTIHPRQVGTITVD